MRSVRAILVPRTAGSTTTHRRSRIAVAMLGVALAALIVPGVASANHGRPHPETYLPELQQHFALEYPATIESQALSTTLLDGRQGQLAIEYRAEKRSGHATHYGPPGR